MLPKNDVVLNSNDVVGIIRVLAFKVLKNLQLHACLVLEALLIPNKFNCHDLFGLVIKALESLAKAPLAQELLHFESIRNVVVQHHFVVPSLVIVPVVVGIDWGPLDLLGIQTQEIHLLVVKDFALLEVSQITHKLF